MNLENDTEQDISEIADLILIESNLSEWEELSESSFSDDETEPAASLTQRVIILKIIMNSRATRYRKSTRITTF